MKLGLRRQATLDWSTCHTSFTGKEIDEETGLYYYGARYLDSKYSRWISIDPALGKYTSKDYKGTSGGIYNSINLNLYNYGNNNPIKYKDLDGNEIYDSSMTYEEFAKILLDVFIETQMKLVTTFSQIQAI